MKNCGDIIKRYKAVLKVYSEGGSMKATFEEVGVDRNTIARTTDIAELSFQSSRPMEREIGKALHIC